MEYKWNFLYPANQSYTPFNQQIGLAFIIITQLQGNPHFSLTTPPFDYTRVAHSKRNERLFSLT